MGYFFFKLKIKKINFIKDWRNGLIGTNTVSLTAQKTEFVKFTVMYVSL